MLTNEEKMKKILYHFTSKEYSDVFFTAYETNIPNVYELNANNNIKGRKFTHIFCNSDGLFYPYLTETGNYDSDFCLGAYDVSPEPSSTLGLTSNDGSVNSYKIIGFPKVIRTNNSELYISVDTEPPNANGFPANSQNVRVLGVQNQVYIINIEIQKELSAKLNQDSPSSKATNSPFRHK